MSVFENIFVAGKPGLPGLFVTVTASGLVYAPGPVTIPAPPTLRLPPSGSALPLPRAA